MFIGHVVFLFFPELSAYTISEFGGVLFGESFKKFLVEFLYPVYPLFNNSLSYICDDFPHFAFQLCHFHSEVLTFILSCMSIFAIMSFFERSSAPQYYKNCLDTFFLYFDGFIIPA